MNHEIHTPLNAIVGFPELLQVTDYKAEQAEYETHSTQPLPEMYGKSG